MNIDIVVVGPLQTNCYIISQNNHVLIIDPGADYSKIIKVVGDRIIDGIVITHYHFDHIGALKEFYLSKVFDRNNLSEGTNIIGDFKFEVIYTPGHKEDSISLYFDKIKSLFVGDFIFKNSIGRTDLPGGNIDDMVKSLLKTSSFDNDVIIYPGHGKSTTFEYERRNNIYFKSLLK